MKKYLIITAILLVSFHCMGQTNKDFVPEWNFGAGFGVVFPSVDFQSPSNGSSVSTKTNLNFQGGIAARYISEKYLGVIGELNYTQLGWSQDFRENPKGYEYSRKLNYLEMPMMTQFYVGSKARLVINIGPKIGMLLSENEKMNTALRNDVASGIMSDSLYTKSADVKFDYGLVGGLGMELRTDIGNFTVEGRYYFGLGDIFDNSKKTGTFSRSAHRALYAKITYYTKLF